MQPKEKAIAIHTKYINLGVDNIEETAKQCALIAVEEIIKQWEYIDIYLADMNGDLNPNLKYWYDVLAELNTL